MNTGTLLIIIAFGMTGWFTLIAAMAFEEFHLVERASALLLWGRYLLAMAVAVAFIEALRVLGVLAWMAGA